MAETKKKIPDQAMIVSKFRGWLEKSITELTPTNSVDIHIDQLVGPKATVVQMLEESLALFRWVRANGDPQLIGKIAMLMIPLKNSPSIDRMVPRWSEIGSQLSDTPPSIYVLNASSYVQMDPAQRYIALGDVPALADLDLSIYYQCWRNPDLPEDEGWLRDVRAICSSFVR